MGHTLKKFYMPLFGLVVIATSCAEILTFLISGHRILLPIKFRNKGLLRTFDSSSVGLRLFKNKMLTFGESLPIMPVIVAITRSQGSCL